MTPIFKLTFVLWEMFFLGVSTKILARAGFAIRNPVNPVANRRAFLKANWDVLLIRSIWDCVSFLVWQNNPTILTKGLALTGIPLNFDIPVTAATAFGFGVWVDFFWDWLGNVGLNSSIPAIKVLGRMIGGQIPPLPPIFLVKQAYAAEASGTEIKKEP